MFFFCRIRFVCACFTLTLGAWVSKSRPGLIVSFWFFRFYTLMVLSTALFGKPAFQNLICNGLVLADDGKKMSKSLKNYPSPMEIIDQYGAVSLLEWTFFFPSFFPWILCWMVGNHILYQYLVYFVFLLCRMQYDYT